MMMPGGSRKKNGIGVVAAKHFMMTSGVAVAQGNASSAWIGNAVPSAMSSADVPIIRRGILGW
jgi:hypothetical protein